LFTRFPATFIQLRDSPGRDVQEGFGLDAVRNILKLQFTKHEFELKNENGVKIRVLIPKMEISNEV